MDERIPGQTTFRVTSPFQQSTQVVEGNPPLELHIIERALMQFEGRIALDDLRGLLEGTGLEDSSGSGDNITVH